MKSKQLTSWIKRWWGLILFILFIIVLVRLWVVGSQINNVTNNPINLESYTYEQAQDYVKANLEAQGYIVGFVNRMETVESKKALVSMNSSGERNTQVIEGALVLNSAKYFNDATNYVVYLSSPEETCAYVISRLSLTAFVRAYYGENLTIDGTVYDAEKLGSYLANEIEDSEDCFQP
ncbi:MAG: hypothetical protein WCI72_01120 [archaeon]